MPIARGTFRVFNLHSFRGLFDVEGFEMHVEGRFTESIPAFDAPDALLEYYNISDLIGSYAIASGFIGINTFDVQFEGSGGKKTKLTGIIPGGLDRRYIITGSATWDGHKE